MKKRIVFICMLGFAYFQIIFAQTGNGGEFLTLEQYKELKKIKKDSLSRLRATYPIKVVDHLPPIDWWNWTDEELIAFCLGRGMICVDGKKEFYETELMRRFRTGEIERKVAEKIAEAMKKRFLERYKRIQALQKERYSVKIPPKPKQQDAKAITAYNEACKRDAIYYDKIQKELEAMEVTSKGFAEIALRWLKRYKSQILNK